MILNAEGWSKIWSTVMFIEEETATERDEIIHPRQIYGKGKSIAGSSLPPCFQLIPPDLSASPVWPLSIPQKLV